MEKAVSIFIDTLHWYNDLYLQICSENKKIKGFFSLLNNATMDKLSV